MNTQPAPLSLLFLLTCAVGCIERTASADGDPDQAPDADVFDQAVIDARLDPPDMTLVVDAAPRADLGVRSIEPLARALTCDLTRQHALTASVRYVACLDPQALASVSGVLEAWEAGLFLGSDPSAANFASVRLDLGCNAWRCIAAARDCEAARACFNPIVGDRCDLVEQCAGDSILRCGIGSQPYAGLDCGLLGLGCQPGDFQAQCENDACSFGGGVYEFVCQGNRLEVCDGSIGVDCDAWRPGSICQSFAIGGEVPINFCGPPGFGGAGAYSSPVECDGDTIRFETLQTDRFEFDCRGAGYAGCNERGCVE